MRHRGTLTVTLALILGLACRPAHAAPHLRSLVADNAALVIEIDRPLRLLEHPLIRNATAELQNSGEVQLARQSPDLDRLHQTAALLEAATGLKWPEAVQRLTAGGIVLGLTRENPPQATLIVTADNPELMSRFVSRTREFLIARDGSEPGIRLTGRHRDSDLYQAGNGHYAVAGRHLVVTCHDARLKTVLDGLANAARSTAVDPRPSDAPLVRATLDLNTLRHLPDIQKLLTLPSGDAGQIALLGGWIDLLRRFDTLEVDLSLPDESLALALRFDNPNGESKSIPGFAPPEPSAGAAPLLNPPGTIFSVSWYRDYAALWHGRAALLTTEAREKLDKGNANLAKQLEVIGLKGLPNELVEQLGPHFRLVAARQQELTSGQGPGRRCDPAHLAAKHGIEDEADLAAFFLDLFHQQPSHPSRGEITDYLHSQQTQLQRDFRSPEAINAILARHAAHLALTLSESQLA